MAVGGKEDEANTSVEVINDTSNNNSSSAVVGVTPPANRRTIQIGSYRRISFDEKTAKRSNRTHSNRMNRISSLRSRRHCGQTENLSSTAKSTELISASLDRLTGSGVGHQYSGNGDDGSESNGVVINEVREYHQHRQQQRQCSSTVSSGNHSSIFSNDNDTSKKKGFTTEGEYSPNKSTLGLELVASPSLLRQVLTPNGDNNSCHHHGGGESVGGSTLSSTRSFSKETERGKGVRCVGSNSVVEETRREVEEEETNNDEDSVYSAMPTVADTATAITAKSFRSRSAMNESEQEQQQQWLAEEAIAAKPKMMMNQPLPLRQTYSMRSVKTSEGMEVGQFYFTNNDDHGKKADGSLNESTSNNEAKQQQQPFDETDAKIIASSKTAAAASSSSQTIQRPPSCLKPSSFYHPTKKLVSPAFVQNQRVSSNLHSRSARIAKFRSTFDKHRNSHQESTSLNNTNGGDVTITQVEEKKGMEEETNLCFSAPVVSFAEEKKSEKRNISGSAAAVVVAAAIAASKKPNGKRDPLGHQSPTSVNEFFSEEEASAIITSEQQKQKQQSIPSQEDSINSSNTGSTKSSIDGNNSSITNRVAKNLRNRQALKSMALAKKSSSSAKEKRGRENQKAELGNAVSPAEQEGNNAIIVQSVSDLGVPQFRPSESEDGVKSRKEEVIDAADVNATAETTPATACVSTKALDSSREIDEDDEDPNSQSIELDASILLNTSYDSTVSKKKRFLFSRMRRKRENGAASAVGSTPKSSSKSASNEKVRSSGGGKRSIKSKLFGKKREENKHEPTKSEEELARIKEVEKYTAWLAPTTQPAADEYPMDEYPMDELPTTSKGEKQEGEEAKPFCPEEAFDRSSSAPSTKNAVVGAASAVATAPDVANDNDKSSTMNGIESSEAGLINEKDPTTSPFTLEEDTQACKSGKQLPFFGLRARSSSTKNSKSSSNSKSSINSKLSKSPVQTVSEPESPCRERSLIPEDDGSPLLGKETTRVASSSQSDFANFGAALPPPKEDASEPVAQEMTTDAKKNSSFEEEMANAQIEKMFPDFSSAHFVGGDVSGEVEHGVEVEYGVQVLGPSEFGHEGIALDTSAVVSELSRSLSEAKWDNSTKVGDDISWPSEVVSYPKTPATKSDAEETPLKILNDSTSSPESNVQGIEEASTKSGGTKSSALYPRKLFRRRSKDRREYRQKVKEEEEEEEESVSDFKRFVSQKKRSPHPAEKRRMPYNARGKDDSRSIDEESDDYSSDEYSSDGREDLVGAIATSLNKGFTGIVDMMENAFAFNKEEEETIDYESESSESEDDEDEDSYIQRKMARRRDKQRRLLHEARRSSRRQQHEVKRRSKSKSNEEENQRRHRHRVYSRKYASTGRAMSRRRVESPRYEY